MANTTLRLLRGVSFYSFAIFAPRLLRLLTVPLVVHAVSIETYGVFVILMMIVPFAQVLADCGTGTAALRLAPEESNAGKRSLFSSLLTLRVVAAALLMLGLLLLARPLTQSLTNGKISTSLFTLVIANVIPAALITAFGAQLRSEERHATLSLVNMTQAVIETACTISWVVLRPGGLRGLLLATLCAKLLVLGPLVVLCRSSLGARPTRDRIVRLLRLGAPIGLLYLITGLREIDRYLIKIVLGLADVARYDLALRIVGPVALANAALGMALQPHAYRAYAAPSGRRMISLFLSVYVAFFATVAFGISALAPEVLPFLAPGSYRGAASIAPALIFAFVGDGVLYVVGLGADLAKRTTVWAIVAIAHLLIALPLTWFLLPRAGLLGAALGLLIATLSAAALCRMLVQKIYPIDMPVARSLVLIVIGTVGCTVLVVTAQPGFASLALRAGATLAFFALCWRLLDLEVSKLRAVLAGDYGK